MGKQAKGEDRFVDLFPRVSEMQLCPVLEVATGTRLGRSLSSGQGLGRQEASLMDGCFVVLHAEIPVCLSSSGPWN